MNSLSGFSTPLSEDGCVWSLSLLESVGAGWVGFGCVGVSVPSSVGFLCDASFSADARSLGTWQQEEQTVMLVDRQFWQQHGGIFYLLHYLQTGKS